MWYFLDGAYARPCSACGTPGCTGGCDPCSTPPAQSDNIVYSGPNLPCSGINTCDTLTIVIQKIEVQLCDIFAILAGFTTTTTTTIAPPCVVEGYAVYL